MVDCCYDVPLLKSLELLLATSVVQEQVRYALYLHVQCTLLLSLNQVFNSHCSCDERLGDYCDGEQYKLSELFCEDPCALQLNIYYDEVDVCNEIGSKSTVHKLGKSRP